MAIYVKFAEEKKPKSIKEFLLKVFSCNSIYGYLQNIKTFSNKECTITQCVENKYRSFDDILELVQTYYKTATPKKVFKELLDLRPINNKGEVCSMYRMSCSGINKINFLYVRKINLSKNQTSYNYNCKEPKLNSKYSWKELFAMININSEEDLTNYLAKLDEK